MTEPLTDAEIIENSSYSLEYLNKLKADNPTMFTSKKWNDLRSKIILSRQRHYYAISKTKQKEKRRELINQLPRKQQKSANAVPAIITKNCGTSKVKLKAFRMKNPDLFSDADWEYFKGQLRKQQCTISSSKYRNRKANPKQSLVITIKLPNNNQENPVSTVPSSPNYSYTPKGCNNGTNVVALGCTINRHPTVYAGLETQCPDTDEGEQNDTYTQSNALELSSQSSSIDNSEDNLLDLLMPTDYSSMMLTYEDFNMIDSCNNLFLQPGSP